MQMYTIILNYYLALLFVMLQITIPVAEFTVSQTKPT